MLYVAAEISPGEKFFESTRIYMPQSTNSLCSVMALGPDKKLGLVRDTSIQPFAPKEERFEIPVPNGAKGAKITVRLEYQPRPGDIYPIHTMARTVDF